MVIIGVLILGYSLKDIKLSILIRDLAHINLVYLFVAFLCICIYLLIEACITKILVSSSVKGFTFKDALRVPLVEQLFNGITPFSSGGQPGQLFVMVQSGIDGGKASSILLIKFVVYQLMIVINFFISLLIGFNFVAKKLHYLALFLIFGFLIHLFVIIGLLMVMYIPKLTKRLVNILIYPIKWFKSPVKFDELATVLDKKIDILYAESIRLGRSPKLILKISGLTFIQLLFYYLIPYFIMISLGYTSANVMLVVSLHVIIVMIISLFPIPGGSGGAEFSFEALFSNYITSHSKLVVAMVIWRLITYYFGMIMGAIALIVKPDKVKDPARKN